MNTFRLILLSVTVASFVACGDDGYDGNKPTSAGGGSQTETAGETVTAPESTMMTGSQPAAPVSFSKDVQPVFTSNCAFVGCHVGASPTAGQDLSEGKAFGSIVGVAAKSSCAGQPRVSPSNPDASVLVKKIEGTTCGTRMPKGRTPLASDQIALIRSWIQQGAQSN